MSIERLIPSKIEKNDIEPIALNVGETEIVLQRHGKYEKSSESANVGSLTLEGAQEIEALADNFFEELFSSIPESERGSIDILLLASDTQYKSGGRRSMETAGQVMKTIKSKMAKFGLSDSQLLNRSENFSGDGGPRPHKKLREPQMIEKSPDFLQFLKEKYGDMGLSFWMAFEEDKEKETREKMGAEGPDQIADRLSSVVETLSRYGRLYHQKHPGRRLLIWATTHYDTISPYTKREILHVEKNLPLAVDYGAGIVISITKEGKRKAKIAGNEYEVPSRKNDNIQRQ